MRTGNIMIGAVKSGKIVFDGHKRVFYKTDKGDDFVAFVSGYDEITTDPGNSEEVTKKLQSWAKRKGFKINKGIGAVKKVENKKDDLIERLRRSYEQSQRDARMKQQSKARSNELKELFKKK